MNLMSRLKDIKEKKENKEEEPQKKAAADESCCALGGREIKNSFGSYYLLQSEYELENLNFPLISSDLLYQNLRLVKGVGPVTENMMREKGINCLQHLAGNKRWKQEVETVLDCICKKRITELKRRGAHDLELLSFYGEDDLVFLDIESTGLWANQPLFLVGILFKEENKLKLQQYLARNLEEERPLLVDLNEKLKNYRVMVTYNGKKFDAPYIEGRSVEHRLFYKLQHYQLDLLYHARKHFKGSYPNCRLVTLEEYLLNFKREGDIPGYLIPQTYYKFIKTKDYNLIKDIIKHNALDLITLAKILYIVQPCLDAYTLTAVTE